MGYSLTKKVTFHYVISPSYQNIFKHHGDINKEPRRKLSSIVLMYYQTLRAQ